MDIEKILNKSIQNFPRWMDIRKRHNKSRGGQYFHSIIDELYEVEQELIEFKKEFFAVNYIGKENTIIDYVYYSNIGEVDLEKFEIIDPVVNITTNFKDFYLKHYDAYYQDGMLYFLENYDNVRYKYKDAEYDVVLSKFHVWNIFDEFALFLGLNRFENEDNKRLLDRVFRAFRYPTNSTHDGIKNVLLNALSSYNKDIHKNDILIEKPSRDNLFERYGDEYIIDYLIDFNKDVYRSKVWDESHWSHDFVDLEYIFAKWDEHIEHRTVGTAYNALDSRFAKQLDKELGNTITLDIYQQSEKVIEDYIKKNKIPAEIDLQLTRFDDVIQGKSIQYKVAASEAYNITNENIIAKCYNQTRRYSKYKIEHLLETPENYEQYINRPKQLKHGNKYRLEFYPLDQYKEMSIDNVKLHNETESIDILKNHIEEDDFELLHPMVVRGNSIYNSRVKLHTSALDQFVDYSNIKLELDENGAPILRLDDPADAGEIKINIERMENTYCVVPISANTISILSNRSYVVPSTQAQINHNNITIPKTITGNVDIRTDFKALEISIQSGDCMIERYGKNDELISRNEYYGNNNATITMTDSSVKRVKIIKIGNSELIITDIRYSNYDIEYIVDGQKLKESSYGVIIPKGDELTIKLKAYTSYDLKINYIFIGHPMQLNYTYHTIDFTLDGDEDMNLQIDASSKVRLIDVTNNKVISENYNSTSTIKNHEIYPIELILNLINVRNIEYSNVKLSKIPGRPYIYSTILPPGESLETVILYSDNLMPIKEFNLLDEIKQDSSDAVYVSNILDGYIVKSSDGKERLIDLTKEMIGSNVSYVSVKTDNELLQPVFVSGTRRQNKVFKNEYDKNFSFLNIFYKPGEEYISNNSVNVYEKITDRIKINQVFTPILDTKKSLAYKIVRPRLLEQDISIYFKNNNTWTLGQKDITVELPIDLNKHETYDYKIENTNNTVILKNRIPLDITNRVSLSEYFIEPPKSMAVMYTPRRYQEEVIVKHDGFNKLQFANIRVIEQVTINGETINKDDYRLLNRGGYIIWETEKYVGQIAKVYYQYHEPQYIYFSDYNDLYRKVGYNVEAYKFLETVRINTKQSFGLDTIKLKSGTRVTEDFKIIAKCSHPLYSTSIEDDQLKVFKMNTNDLTLITRTGFYYDDNREYYYFVDNNPKDKIVKSDYYESKGGDYINNELFLYQESKNYLTYSSMRLSYLDELCMYNFKDEHIVGEISKLKELTACDNYTKWVSYNNNISINNESLEFSIEDNKIPISYSYIKLPVIKNKNMLITFKAENSEYINLASSGEHVEQKLNNTHTLRITNKTPTIRNGYAYFIINGTDKDLYMLNFNDNEVSNIIVKEYIQGEDIEALHIKNIDKLNFDIEEHNTESTIQRLYFDTHNSIMYQTDIGKDQTILLDASTQWGMTKLFDYKDNLTELKAKNVGLKKNIAEAKNGIGTVRTKPIFLPNHDSIKEFVATINDVIMPSTSGFNIKVYSVDRSDHHTLIYEQNKTNRIVLPNALLTEYIALEIEMPDQSIINNIEGHCQYFENIDSPINVQEYEYGFLDTKIYDTGKVSDVIIKKIRTNKIKEAKDVAIYVRSYKKDNNNFVYNPWVELIVDNEGNIINEHILRSTRYIQFRTELLSKNARIKINSIEVEVK